MFCAFVGLPPEWLQEPCELGASMTHEYLRNWTWGVTKWSELGQLVSSVCVDLNLGGCRMSGVGTISNWGMCGLELEGTLMAWGVTRWSECPNWYCRVSLRDTSDCSWPLKYEYRCYSCCGYTTIVCMANTTCTAVLLISTALLTYTIV